MKKIPKYQLEAALDKLATRKDRLTGYAIDKVLIYMAAVYLRSILAKMEIIDPSIQTEIFEGVSLFLRYSLAFLLLNGWLLYSKGQTIGKMITETRIVGLQGEKVPAWKIYVLRELIFWGPFCFIAGMGSENPQNPVFPVPSFLYMLFLLINGICIFRSDRRCIHDLVCQTRVVQDVRGLSLGKGFAEPEWTFTEYLFRWKVLCVVPLSMILITIIFINGMDKTDIFCFCVSSAALIGGAWLGFWSFRFSRAKAWTSLYLGFYSCFYILFHFKPLFKRIFQSKISINSYVVRVNGDF